VTTSISEFRIYFECLEQAEHFGINPIESAIKREVPSRLVRLPGRVTDSLAKSLVAPFAMKNPDLVISCIADNKEFPLLWIEISTSVRTEDHAYQRFDSMVAASKSPLVFLKVQADRVSGNSHGGRVDFDEAILFQVARQNLGLWGLQLEWPTTADGRRALRDSSRKACPPSDLGVGEILNEIVHLIDATGEVDPSLTLRSGRLSRTYANQLLHHLSPIPALSTGRSTRIFRDGRQWNLKFNRWGHAMDPERGASWFYRHRIGQRLSGLIHDKDAKTRGEAIANFSAATGIDVRAHSKTSGSIVDITDAVSASSPNRSGLAILENCKDFRVCDINGNALVEFVWRGNPSLAAQSHPAKTQICLTTTTNEDEVTYAVAHYFLPKVGFKCHSISYPGAQGDFALLEGSGRTTKRTYVDIIGVDSLRSPNQTLLVESKGKRNRSDILKDAEKVSSWRDSSSRLQILRRELGLTGRSSPVVGCAYPGDSFLDDSRTLPGKIDYEICVGRTVLRYRHRSTPNEVCEIPIAFPVQYEVRN